MNKQTATRTECAPQVPPATEQITHLSEKPYSYWLSRNNYYHAQTLRRYQFMIPAHATVLHISGKNGAVLHALNPLLGVCVEASAAARAEGAATYPSLLFYESLDAVNAAYSFDYVLLSLATMEVDDVQQLLEQIRPVCHAGTRLILETYSYAWEPILRVAQYLGLRRPTTFKNWVSQEDLANFVTLAGFEVVAQEKSMLMPINIPLLAPLCNNMLIHIPGLNALSLTRWLVARPRAHIKNSADISVSVIIPCRNERGNVEAAVQRCPVMGKHTELIFVEGNSKDGTYEEIIRVQRAYPALDIKVLKQDGKGKGDAVRKGFAHATGDVLMILDADLTMPPEELPKFFNALVRGTGEFINGSRLVYGMESEAMRFLNLLANHFFSVLFSWLLNQRVKDTLCGTKVLWREDYRKIAANRAYFGDFDPFGDFDLLFGAAKLQLKIIDMPIRYKNRTYGSTQIRRFYHGWILLGMSMLAIKKFKVRS